MGNKFAKRPVIDERYTRPQGLYEHRNLNLRKLRRLILNGQLAPCYPAVEDSSLDLDDCPICLLSYPSLNRSKCCNKGICTECYLKVKSPHSPLPIRCPFCKTSNYLVEYRGAKTNEEKDSEQMEEQKVIEAKIRIQQEELRDEEIRILGRDKQQYNEYLNLTPRRDQTVNCTSLSQSQNALEHTRIHTTSMHGFAGLSNEQNVPHISASSSNQLIREEEYDLDLEDLMVMEAIWLSLQEQGHTQSQSLQRNSQAYEEYGDLYHENVDAQTSGWTVVPRRRMFSNVFQRESRASMSDLVLDQSSEHIDDGTTLSSSVPSASDQAWRTPDFIETRNTRGAGSTQSHMMSYSFVKR